jgi:hypothetical protein
MCPYFIGGPDRASALSPYYVLIYKTDHNEKGYYAYPLPVPLALPVHNKGLGAKLFSCGILLPDTHLKRLPPF